MNSEQADRSLTMARKNSRKNTAFLIAPVLIATSFFVFALFFSEEYKKNLESSPTERATPDTVISIGPEVIEVFREVSVLDVFQMDVTQTLVRNLQDLVFDVRIGSMEITGEYRFTISAGIDLGQVSADDIAVDHPGNATRVTATLPWPDVTGICCLNKSYSVNESFLFRESDEVIAAALSQMDNAAVDLARERALSFSLIDRAAEAGKSEVEEMILTLGADIAVVRYR